MGKMVMAGRNTEEERLANEETEKEEKRIRKAEKRAAQAQRVEERIERMRKEDLIAPEVKFDDLEETLEEEAEEFISETIKNIKIKQTINQDLKNVTFVQL